MQYEISNFAKRGKACRHNLRYWNCDEYLGFGPAAHSYFGGKRFSFKKDVKLYIDSFNEEKKVSESLVDEYIDIPPSARIAEYVMLRSFSEVIFYPNNFRNSINASAEISTMCILIR